MKKFEADPKTKGKARCVLEVRAEVALARRTGGFHYFQMKYTDPETGQVCWYETSHEEMLSALAAVQAFQPDLLKKAWSGRDIGSGPK